MTSTTGKGNIECLLEEKIS